MRVIQSPLFARKVKKFHKNQKSILDTEIKKILGNPQLGQQKKGDLRGIFVHKFKMRNRQFLLAYRIRKEVLELTTIALAKTIIAI